MISIKSTAKTATPNPKLRRSTQRSSRDNHDESKSSIGRKQGLLSGPEDHPTKVTNRLSAVINKTIEKHSRRAILSRESLATAGPLTEVHQEAEGTTPKTRTSKRPSEQQHGGGHAVVVETRSKAPLSEEGSSLREETGVGRTSVSRAGNEVALCSG